MRILRPSIKKVTPRRVISSANGVFRRMLTPSSVQLSSKSKENGNANCVLPRSSSTPSLKSVQRFLNYKSSPHIIPVTPTSERSKVSTSRKIRISRLKHTHAKKRRLRTRILVGTSLVLLYYCKSGGQISASKNTNTASSIENGPVEKFPSAKQEEESSKTKALGSLKRKARTDDSQLNRMSSKRLRVDRKGFGEWQNALTEASERLQDVPLYPTMLAQTSTRNNADQPRFGDWQKALAEASERLQTVPPYPTILSQRKADSRKRRITIKLPVAAVKETVKNLVDKLPAVAQVKDHVKNLGDKVPVVTMMREGARNLADRLPNVATEVRDQVANLASNLAVGGTDAVKQTGQIAKKWTELPLPATYSHPILQQKEKQERRQQSSFSSN